MNEQLNITETENNQNDIASRFDCQVKQATCELKLPMTITLKKDELDRGYYDGRTNHNGKADFLYSYCKKKKIPLEEPKNKEGRYDRYIIKLETPEQALNLLLWDKFEALSKLSG